MFMDFTLSHCDLAAFPRHSFFKMQKIYSRSIIGQDARPGYCKSFTFFFFFKNGIQATRLEEQRPGKMLQIIIASIY